MVGPNLLKLYINFILCFWIDSFIKVNINETILRSYLFLKKKWGLIYKHDLHE